MKVYADLLFIENFLVSIFLIFITSETMSIRPKLKKIILPSIIAGLYTFTIFTSQREFFTSIPIKVIMVILFMYLYFRNISVKLLFKSSLIYISYSMLLAGLCIFLDMESKGKVSIYYTSIDFSYKFIMESIMILYIIVRSVMYYITDKKIMNKYIYVIQIEGCGWKCEVNAFLDTGNELREPVTKLPVVIVEKDILKDVALNPKDSLVIPYQDVDGKTGKIYGYMVRSIKIFLNDGDMKEASGIIALCNGKLSENNEYNALLSRGLMVNVGG